VVTKKNLNGLKKATYQQKYDGLDEVVKKLKDVPVYIAIDLDVLDPSVFPGTGTPEPGGITYKELLCAFEQFSKLNKIVGADIVELSPMLDPSQTSTIVAAKSLRELILILQKQKQN
jgi:agmatinase